MPVKSDVETTGWTYLLSDGGLPSEVVKASGDSVSGLPPGPVIPTGLQHNMKVETMEEGDNKASSPDDDSAGLNCDNAEEDANMM